MLIRRISAEPEGALGIGAMILFIAMIILATIVGAVIIGMSELISQQTEKSAAETTPDISRKIIINSIWIGDNVDDYLIMISYHTSGSSVSPTDVYIHLYCTTSAGVFHFLSTPLVGVGPGTGSNPGVYGYNGLDVWEITANPASGNTATLEPGRSYFVRLDGDHQAASSNCRPDYLISNDIAGNLWFHIEGGLSTHVVFNVNEKGHGTKIL